MPVKKDAWKQGTPAWVDLMASDFEGAKAYYAGLFGWEFQQSGEEYGGYATATLNGESVAGIGPAQGPDAPPAAWTTYLAVDDASAAVAAAAEAGATVFMAATEVGPMGSMAVLADPTGAVFGVWQAGLHTGFNCYNEPGADVWNEAMVTDYQAGKDFYGSVFGLGFTEIGDEHFSYAMLEVDGETAGGLGAVADGSSHWNTYFEVTDAEAAVARAVELGGEVVTPLSESPYGISAEIRGPGGERFLVIEPPKQPADG